MKLKHTPTSKPRENKYESERSNTKNFVFNVSQGNNDKT